MHLRPKTIRRLLIIGVVFAVIFGIIGTMWLVNARRSADRIAQARADAMATFEKGDYAAALPHFAEYLSKSKTAEKQRGEADTEALLAYGKSRQAIKLPRARHLVESIKIFERYLQLDPGNGEAQHLLLALYPRVKYNEEALKLAGVVLAENPDDPPAWRARVLALTNQRKYKEALAAAEELIQRRPNDLDAHAYVQRLMIELVMPGEEKAAAAKIVARYEDLLRRHPNDPRFELLLAMACDFANDRERATNLLRQAAGRSSTDPEVAARLTTVLERHNLFSESDLVLERLAAANEDPLHVRPLVRRMWQSGRDKDVLKRTESQDPASPDSDTDLLAYRALALYDLNRPADAAPIVNALAARQDDMAALAWATALRARQDENLAPRQRARQYQEALERAPTNEVIHYFLGVAYATLGESEPALVAWREAARLAPSWSAPAAAISRTLAATGRSREALDAAFEAYRRAPKALSTVTGYIVAWFAEQQQNPNSDDQKRLLDLVERVQSQIPGEPETLHIYATLLSRTGQRTKAASVIESALTNENAPPRDTLLALASVSYTEKLGLEGNVLEFAERVYGLSPQIAVRKAVLLAQAGKPKEGLKLLEAARKQQAKSDPTQWTLAVLQYRESIGDRSVLPEWVKLGDANPDNALVQSAMLRSELRVNDKAFWLRTIERLKRLTGEEALTPRIERARWLLTGETTQKDASEAILLLGDVERLGLPEIHRLLGIAHEKNAAHTTGPERAGLLRTAADELEKAFDARNADPAVASDLTRVYRAMGRDSEADRVMSRIAYAAGEMGLDGRKRTARTLIAQGQLQRAIEVLEPMGDGQDVIRDALLCGLYRRTGNLDKAAAMYRRLLNDERAEPATIADGADFFASRGETAEAGKFLEKLRTVEVAPTSRELLLAQYAERHGKPEDALRHLEAAVAADPAHPSAWQGLVGHHLRRLQFPEAIAAADRGLKAIPDDANLMSLRARASALKNYRDDANMAMLATELSNDPQSAAITDMVRIMSEARSSGQSLQQTLPRLRELADRNVDLLRLQMFVAQAHARLGQQEDAERVALRATLRAPNDPEPARVLTAIYAARSDADRWSKVLEAARQWRQRSLDNPLAADVTIARTLLEMRRPDEAIAQLKPYVPTSATTGPATTQLNPIVIEVYAQALLRTGQSRRVAALLAPLTQSEGTWRRIWLQLAPAGFDKLDDATKWIEHVLPMLTSEPAEQIALAEAWIGLGSRFSSTPALENAKGVIEPLTRSEQSAAEGWRLLANVSELTGEMDKAALAYRKLLSNRPDNPDLQNNLAYALLENGRAEDLPEARRLAEAAVAKAPTSSTYLDTLARVHLKSGDLAAAEQTFQRALDAQQGSIEAMIGLADVHARAGRRTEARDLLVRINSALPSGTSLPAPLQRQLDNVRQSVKEPVQSGRIE